MPELEYCVLADYVREDAGTVHIMGAGIDTYTVPESTLPVAVASGLVVRLSFDSRDDAGADHTVEVHFEGPTGKLLETSQTMQTPARIRGTPEHWRTAVNILFRMGLPLPVHGDYRLQVTIDSDPRMSRTIDIRTIPPPETAGATKAG